MISALLTAAMLAALPSSGTIGISTVRTHFGQSIAYFGRYCRGDLTPNTEQYAGVTACGGTGLKLSQFYLPTVSVAPTSVSGECWRTTSGSCSATTAATTASPVGGGSGAYTYSWSYVSGTTYTVNNSTTSSPTFSRSATVHSTTGMCNSANGYYRVRVVAPNGNVVYSGNVTVTTRHCRGTPF